MTTIPDDIMAAAGQILDKTLLAGLDGLKDAERAIAKELLAAEKRGEERERERCATHLFDREAFMTAVSGNGDPYVKVRFKTLKEMQSFHRELCNLAAAIRKGSE